MNHLEKLRLARQDSVTVYKAFLNQQGQNTIHLFFEGKTDPSFYNRFLVDFGVDLDSAWYYNCGNKDKVYETRNRIIVRQNPPSWSDTQVILYFVDKDLSDVLCQDYPEDGNIFVTKYYSIENYLVTRDMLKTIWVELISCSCGVKPPVTVVAEMFLSQLRKFHVLMRPIMLWTIYHRQRGRKIEFGRIHLQEYFGFDENVELQIQFSNDVMGIIAALDRVCHVTTSDAHFQTEEALIVNMHPKSYIRGKFEVWFLREFVCAILQFIRRDMQTMSSCRS